MKPEFSLAQLTVLHASPVEMVKIAANCGYDYVSMRQIYMGLPGEPDYDLSKNKEMMDKTEKLMKETGIKLLDIELARIFDGMDVNSYERAMETAVRLGGRHVLSSIWTDDKEYYLEQFAKLCDLAKEYGLTVELEYVPIAAVKNLEQAVEVLNTVKRNNAGIMIDIHHFQRAGDDVKDLLEVPREWFRFAHLCDACSEIPIEIEEMTRILREERDYVGQGGIGVDEILKAMPRIPYSIESPNLKMVERYGYEGHAKKCLDNAKEYINNIKDFYL